MTENGMEFDELKAGWAALDRRLTQVEGRASGKPGTGGVGAELRPLVLGQAVQMVFGLALAFGAGSLWVGCRNLPSLLVTGLLLHAYAVAMIVAAARNLVLAGRVNQAAPVLELQHRVAALRAWRIREGRWFGIVGCFMWVGLVIWGFALLGVDIVAARPLFVASLLATAAVCLAVFVVVSRLDRAPEGSSVRRAAERLAEVARFGDEPGA